MNMKFLLAFVLLILAFLAFKRGRKLQSWLPLKGKVLGSATMNDVSTVRIEFIDPQGVSRTFESGIGFDHSYRTKATDRIPFEVGNEVSILVNPLDFTQAELSTSLYLKISLLLFLAAGYATYSAVAT